MLLCKLSKFSRSFVQTFVVCITIQIAGVSSLKSVLNVVKGTIGAGNYTYYMLKYEGPVELHLTSLKGDADLYISETLDHPTYDYDSHSMSAWSCGDDKIIVPRSFPRPLHIAVYGYPRYETSEFKLEASTLEDEFDPFAELTDLQDDPAEETRKHSDDEPLTLGSIILTVLRSILEILIEIML